MTIDGEDEDPAEAGPTCVRMRKQGLGLSVEDKRTV